MEQFNLVPTSVYNKSCISQSVTKQELPKYQSSQNPTYQIDSLKKEINKNLFSNADSLVDKNLSCPRIKLSISQTSILDGVEIGIFLLDFAQQLRSKNADVPDLYFKWLDAACISPTIILYQNAKATVRGSWVSKTERQKLQRLYTQGGAAYESNWAKAGNLLKASNLPVSKVRQFLHSKLSYTKLTPATRNFKRLETFARCKDEIWCMDLAYVDKLGKDNNGVKYLPVRQNLFGWTVDAKGMKTQVYKETVRAFLTRIAKLNCPKSIWVGKGTEVDGDFKKLCKAEGIQIHSTMSETKAALAERTKRPLENLLYRYMEDNGSKYIDKLTQFVTTLNSRRKCSIDLIPKNVKFSGFLSILYGKPLREFRKRKFKLERKFASRNMTYPSGRVRSHSLHKRFSKLLQFLPEDLQCTQ